MSINFLTRKIPGGQNVAECLLTNSSEDNVGYFKEHSESSDKTVSDHE